jgi:hypothetical protein
MNAQTTIRRSCQWAPVCARLLYPGSPLSTLSKSAGHCYRYRNYLPQLQSIIPLLQPVIERLGYTI